MIWDHLLSVKTLYDDWDLVLSIPAIDVVMRVLIKRTNHTR